MLTRNVYNERISRRIILKMNREKRFEVPKQAVAFWKKLLFTDESTDMMNETEFGKKLKKRL